MTRGIATKFLVPLAVLGLVYSSLLHYRAYRAAREYCQELTDQQAAIALEFNLAIRDYAAEEIRPRVAALLGPDQFVPETMSTSYISRSVFEKVRKHFPDLLIKFSSDNPRNPVNLASADELKVIKYFNAHPAVNRMTSVIDVGGVRYQAYFNAKRMETACLRCHGEPAEAPAALLARYGDQASFHRPLGEVVAMDTVAVPLEKVQKAIAAEVTTQWAYAVLGWVFLVGGIWGAFRFLVSRRLGQMSAHFRAIASEPDYAKLRPMPVQGRDEIADLTRSFNILIERMQATYASLDERVAERTADLALANEELKREIAERQRTQEQLQASKTAAEVATQAKSAFLANMSHEIRTPMTAILGYAELAAETMACCHDCGSPAAHQKWSESQQHLAVIRRNGEHLLGVINDILDLSRVESGKMTVEIQPCPVTDIVDDVIGLMRPRVEAKGLTFEVEYLGAVPETIQSDAGRLRQILLNLVGNAVKFTESGGVRVVVRCLGAADETRIEFDVIDTGIGMTAAEAARLFQPFAQADSSTTRRFGGSGLGLAIARSLAQVLGGDVGIVETCAGVGSCFRLTIPTGPLAGRAMLSVPSVIDLLAATPTMRPAATEGGALVGARVLLAEDSLDNQRLLLHMLKTAGAQVVPVANGRDAVEVAMESVLTGQIFDVILMDMNMPVLDGYTATRSLRAQRYTGRIIALTASAMAGDSENCLDAGCDGYAAKPIERHELVALVAECVRARRSEPAATAAVQG